MSLIGGIPFKKLFLLDNQKWFVGDLRLRM